jgi:hypothetical protein
MADRPDGKAAKIERVTFTRQAAERIAKIVRRVEQGDRGSEPLVFQRVLSSPPSSPVRLCKTAAKWAKDTEAELNVWEDGTSTAPEESSPSKTVTASNLFYDVDEGVFVVVAKAANGRWYLVEPGNPDDGSSCKKPVIAGEDLTTVLGYDATKTQVLGHEAGCLKWIDTTTCPEGS